MKSVMRALGRTGPVLGVAAVFLLSFLTFNVLFRASAGDDFYKEIIAALLGTLLAAAVTTLLLKSQSGAEEVRERNVEVFTRRLERFEHFMSLVAGQLDDWRLEPDEALQLRRELYGLAILTSPETFSAVSSFLLRVYDGEEGVSPFEVLAGFRRDLGFLPLKDSSQRDLEGLEKMLQAGEGGAELAGEAQERLHGLRIRIERLLDATDWKDRIEFDEGQRQGDRASLFLTSPGGTDYVFSIGVTDVARSSVVELTGQLSTLARSRRTALRRALVDRGFEIATDYEDDEECLTLVVAAPGSEIEGSTFEGRTVVALGDAISRIIDAERAASRGSRARVSTEASRP